MSAFDLQDGLALAAALAALGWLVRRRLRAKRGGACPDCPVGSPIAGARPAPRATPLVTIEPPARRSGESPRG